MGKGVGMEYLLQNLVGTEHLLHSYEVFRGYQNLVGKEHLLHSYEVFTRGLGGWPPQLSFNHQTSHTPFDPQRGRYKSRYLQVKISQKMDPSCIDRSTYVAWQE